MKESGINRESFGEYLRAQWAGAGIDVGELAEAPYKEKVPGSVGFSLGLSIHRQGAKARAGVWFRPSPGPAALSEVNALRSHYQQTLQKQNRFVRIQNCSTELGTFFLFWETTQSMDQSAWQPFVQLVEEAAQLAFQGESMDEFLERYR